MLYHCEKLIIRKWSTEKSFLFYYLCYFRRTLELSRVKRLFKKSFVFDILEVNNPIVKLKKKENYSSLNSI